MTNRNFSRIGLALALGAGAAYAAAQNQRPPVTLHVGDAAPPISVSKWLKGAPINLKDGKVHVVEFWATWCGPCKVGMPHLSELAEKYKGQVEFTGVSVWESNASKDKTADLTPKVASFVDQAHDMMDYNVAADGTVGTMAKTWLAAAGQNGIPSSFIVDKSGKIAWIGHPLLGLEDALPQVLAGTFNAAAADKIKDDWTKKMAEGQTLAQQLQAAQKAHENAKVIDLADKVYADMPFMVTMTASAKYVALQNTDPAAAAKFADDLLVRYHNAPLVLASTAGVIVSDASGITGQRDYPLALKLIKQASNCLASDFNLGTIYATVLAKNGDYNGAAHWQGDAIKLAQDSGYPQPMIDEAQKKLDGYKAAIAPKNHS